MKAAVLGATGYAGRLLLRLLANHPEIGSVLPVSASAAGQKIIDHDPGLVIGANRKNAPSASYITLEQAAEQAPDVVFSCLPHLSSAKMCGEFIGKAVIIDLSADLRLEDPSVFLRAYGEEAPVPQWLGKAVYGLAEINRQAIPGSDLIAVPGCYPTASLLPLLPILGSYPSVGKIVVSALSGISGAGRQAKTNLIFSERAENCNAYNPGRTHRHTLEIETNLKKVQPEASILFTPHLVPLKRGMVVTTALESSAPVSQEKLCRCLEQAYKDEPFIGLRNDEIPEAAHVRGSNRCDIGWRVFGSSIMLFSAIDNLVKGAAGQAVQCCNIRFGLAQTTGLPVNGDL